MIERATSQRSSKVTAGLLERLGLTGHRTLKLHDPRAHFAILITCHYAPSYVGGQETKQQQRNETAPEAIWVLEVFAHLLGFIGGDDF